MSKKQIPHITCEHFLALHGQEERQHVVVDLRDRIEFEAGHIKNSVNVPHKELETNIENLIADKSKKVIVIVGPTQEEEIHTIHDILDELGYKNVEFLAGGFGVGGDIGFTCWWAHGGLNSSVGSDARRGTRGLRVIINKVHENTERG